MGYATAGGKDLEMASTARHTRLRVLCIEDSSVIFSESPNRKDVPVRRVVQGTVPHEYSRDLL